MSRGLPNTCVGPSGEFIYGVHKPQFTALNLRQNDDVITLGQSADQTKIHNRDNFPKASVSVTSPTWVFEIPNAFPFMGATFIVKSSADRMTEDANPFRQKGEDASQLLSKEQPDPMDASTLERLPRALLLALARTSNDPQVLVRLAEQSCRFVHDADTGVPCGTMYEEVEGGRQRPAVLDEHLFELVSNNPCLPDAYKKHMVLLPGVQGDSAIVGEYAQRDTHIWEYLRENSYIPWGHYAANMAHDAVRYDMASLSEEDMVGLRHLYYQRMYVQLAEGLGMSIPCERRPLTKGELEDLRLSLLDEIGRWHKGGKHLPFNATIWGQNFGFDLAPSGYRLNASHQQIHQQFALVSSSMPAFKGGENEPTGAFLSTYTQGDLVARFSRQYKQKTDQDFFETYLKAIRDNRRVDGRADKDRDLFFFQDDNIIAFVPKAQRSQGEVQIMTKVKCGHVMEADTKIRHSLDRAIWLAMKILENLGADMITALEISKRFDNPNQDQRLLYSFLPKHPQSPGGFSEFQQRWIMGHYPEDFARACLQEADKIMGI